MAEIEFEVTRIGERGQIVIPLLFRNRMKIDKGEKFLIIEQGDNLILKRLKAPSREEIESMLKKTREHAKRNNLNEKDLEDALKKARANKNESSSRY
jgi:AbrB family looped-hinge helix DNA binding protein